MVLVDYYLPTEDISSVLIDNIDGIIISMKYLASLGHKRIAYLKGEIEDIGSHDRLIGYYRALDMFDLVKDEELVLGCDFTLKGAYEATKRLLDSPIANPTAIVGVNDVAALGAMEAIKKQNLKIPEDISVMGFDDIDMASEIIPNLTTMHVRKKTLGKLAVQTLLTQIHHEETEYSKVLINPKLIIRESTSAVK
jgi:LacI family transcriptional regulator